MALATTQLLRPRTVPLSPYGGALDITPTTSVSITPAGVRTPSAPLDTNPGGQLGFPGSLGPTPLTLAPAPVTIVDPGTPPPPVAPAPPPGGGQTLLGATGGTPIDTTGGPVGTPAQDQLTNRILDLIAAQYASGAQGGQSPDFGGLLTAPVGPATGAPDTTGTGSDLTGASPTQPKAGHGGLIVLVLLLAGGGYWYWRKHHKKRAA